MEINLQNFTEFVIHYRSPHPTSSPSPPVAVRRVCSQAQWPNRSQKLATQLSAASVAECDGDSSRQRRVVLSRYKLNLAREESALRTLVLCAIWLSSSSLGWFWCRDFVNNPARSACLLIGSEHTISQCDFFYGEDRRIYSGVEVVSEKCCVRACYAKSENLNFNDSNQRFLWSANSKSADVMCLRFDQPTQN